MYFYALLMGHAWVYSWNTFFVSLFHMLKIGATRFFYCCKHRETLVKGDYLIYYIIYYSILSFKSINNKSIIFIRCLPNPNGELLRIRLQFFTSFGCIFLECLLTQVTFLWKYQPDRSLCFYLIDISFSYFFVFIFILRIFWY